MLILTQQAFLAGLVYKLQWVCVCLPPKAPFGLYVVVSMCLSVCVAPPHLFFSLQVTVI